MTEHSCITLTHGDPNKGHGIAKRNSVGFILPNLEVKFIDPETGHSLSENTPGEICVRSECVMKGESPLLFRSKSLKLLSSIPTSLYPHEYNHLHMMPPYLTIIPTSGYYKNEYETSITIDKDGWLHTGDIGYIDDDGDVFLVDRIKELIKYKGFQVLKNLYCVYICMKSA